MEPTCLYCHASDKQRCRTSAQANHCPQHPDNRLASLSPRDKWDLRFLDMAKLVASWSKDPSTKCGAVIVRPDRTIVSMGYNGFPKAHPDDGELIQNRDEKYGRVVHAEMNALLHAYQPVMGCSLYVTGPTCDRCAAHIIQAGISRVVWPRQENDFTERWGVAFKRAVDQYLRSNVDVLEYDV